MGGPETAGIRLALRASKAMVVLGLALFFLAVSFGNLTDYDTNWQFVRHVMAMDTTFQSSGLMWRAITDETVQRLGYHLIIAWEIMTALILLAGTAALLRRLRGPAAAFRRAKALAMSGLTMGFLLYGVGFLVVAAEWFAMWQSDTWNAQATAGTFTLVILAALVYLAQPEPD